MTDNKTYGTVVQQAAPTLYNVSTPSGTLRRNRRHLVRLPESDANLSILHEAEPEESLPTELAVTATNTATNGVATTTSGRGSKPPDRLSPSWM